MSEPRALLALARKLLTLKAKKFGTAPVRRAVSTAYYALFHLLTEAAAGLFVTPGSPHAAALRRTFDHQPMKVASGMVRNGYLPQLFGEKKAFNLPAGLVAVASAFVDLQAERETADYDSARPVRPEKAAQLVATAEQAFTAWESVNGTDEARLYLASFLLYKTWDQQPRGATKPRPEAAEGNPL